MVLYKFKRILLIACILIVTTWFCKAIFFSIYQISTESMVPSIKPGEYVMVVKFPYQIRSPDFWPLSKCPFPTFSAKGLKKIKKGDIIVFDDPLASEGDHPSQKDILIKRCHGIPGDTVQLLDNDHINSQNIDQDRHLKTRIILEGESKGYFVLGENKLNSFDSRYFGSVSEKVLRGKAIAVIWPWPRWLK